MVDITYSCEICETNYGSEEEALACEAQPYTPALEMGSKVMYNGWVCRTGKALLLMTHYHCYTLIQNSADNNGKGYNWSIGYKHERELEPFNETGLEERVVS